MDPRNPRNRWRYGLTALAALPPASLTLERALALVDTGAVPTDKRAHNAKLLADGWDITLWHRLPDGGARQFASVAVCRYDRPEQHEFRWRDDVLVVGFHVTASETPVDAAGAAPWLRSLLHLAAILWPDFVAVDLYDDFLERRGRDLTRDVFGAGLYGPGLVASIGGARLRSLPAMRVETRPDGVLVQVADPPYASRDPEARERVRAMLWPA